MIKLPVEPDDSGEFIDRIEQMVNGLCRAYRPSELVILRIDNWFGQKWLKFSGKVMGAAGFQNYKLTLPPFVPNRVRRQCRYRHQGDAGGYVLTDPGADIHRDQRSVQNLQRFVAREVPETALVWYSGGSKENGRGAIMAYVPTPDGHWTWYVGYASTNGWQAQKLKGISASELDGFMATEPIDS